MLRLGWEEHTFRDVSRRPDSKTVRCLLMGPPSVDTHALILAMSQTSRMNIPDLTDGRVELPPHTKPYGAFRRALTSSTALLFQFDSNPVPNLPTDEP